MKERPIIFNGEMIRAILDGRKTQTRRLTRKPRIYPASVYEGIVDGYHQWYESRGGVVYCRKCPYGIPGDRLYVRETWRIMGLLYEKEPCIQYKADLTEQPCHVPDDWLDVRWEDWYERQSAKLVEDCEKAGLKPNDDYDELYRWTHETCPTRWQPSIHMPKFAARIWLEVVSVRAERLRSITVPDARAEGAPVEYIGATLLLAWWKDTWNSLNAKRGHPWSANDWAWVVEFSYATRT